MADVKVKNPEDLVPLIAKIGDAVKEISGSQSEEKEAREQMEADLRSAITGIETKQLELQAGIEKLTEEEEQKHIDLWDSVGGVENKEASEIFRIWGYGNGTDIDKHIYHPSTEWNPKKGIVESGNGYALDGDMMQMNDMLMIWGIHKCIQKNGHFSANIFKESVMSTKTYELLKYRLSMHPETAVAMKAMDTTANSSWIPTQMSAQFIDQVRLQLKVAALFPRINMPMRSGSFDNPLQSAAVAAYLVGENTDDTGTKIPTRNLTSSKKTFTAIKHAVRMLFSDEMEEDSLVAILPIVTSELVYALATAEEDAIINGDTASTHFDSDVTTATDIQKSFDGIRKAGGTNSSGVPSGNGATDISSLSTANLRTMRKGMGKYGVNPSDLGWIAGISGYLQMLSIAEVLTIDKYGAGATILNGELGKFDGIPIVVSEKVKQNLNTSGYYDGSTTTDTVMMLANRKSFWAADKGSPRTDSERDIETQQTKVVVSRRLTFKELFTAGSNEDTCAIGYSLTT